MIARNYAPHAAAIELEHDCRYTMDEQVRVLSNHKVDEPFARKVPESTIHTMGVRAACGGRAKRTIASPPPSTTIALMLP